MDRKIFILVFILTMLVNGYAQNVSPYWSLSGNSNASTSAKLGTTNSIPLRLFTRNAERIRIDTNGMVSIGTTASFARLTAFNNGSTPATIWRNGANPIFMGFSENTSGSGDFLLSMASNTGGARSVFVGRKARGTLSVPQAVRSGDNLLSMLAAGYDGSTFQNTAAIDFIADGTVGLGKVPTQISFFTGESGKTRRERMRLGSNGNIMIGDSQFVSSSINRVRNMALNYGQMSLQSSSYIDETGFLTDYGPVKLMGNKMTLSEFKNIDPPLSVDPYLHVKTYYRSAAISAEGLGMGLEAWGSDYGVKAKSSDVGVFAEGENTGLIARITPRVGGNGGTIGIVASGHTGVRVYGGAGDDFGYAVYAIGGSQAVYGEVNTDFMDLPQEGAELATSGVYGKNVNMGAGVRAYSKGVGVHTTSDSTYGLFAHTNKAGAFAGYFTGKVFSGSGYFTGSDRKLKQNIKPVASAMELIQKLKPQSYEFRQDGAFALMHLPKGKHFGLIAQEVEEVLPGIVTTSTFDQRLVQNEPLNLDSTGRVVDQGSAGAQKEKLDFKAVNYQELIPLLIKGIQEQQELIEKQHLEKEELLQRIVELEKRVHGLAGPEHKISSNSAFLGDIFPNPVSDRTSVAYNLPEGSKLAFIVISDLKGSIIKRIALAAKSGQLQLNASGLASGTYTCSLIIAGVTISSKQLLVVR